MTITNALASLAVSDITSSSRWYETFIGPGHRPMAGLVEWRFDEGGGLHMSALALAVVLNLRPDDVQAGLPPVGRDFIGVVDVDVMHGSHVRVGMLVVDAEHGIEAGERLHTTVDGDLPRLRLFR